MRKLFCLFCLAGFAAFFAFISGCATSTIQPVSITIMHPAEINMANYKQIVIGEITGNLSEEFVAGLKERLVESGKFKVLDRSSMRQILGELELSGSSLADPAMRARIGKLLTGAALITGRVEKHYRVNLNTTDGRTPTGRKDAQGRDIMRPCKFNTKVGEAATTGSIDIVDVETGAIIKSKTMNAVSSLASVTAVDEFPPDPDYASVVAAVISRNLDDFMKSITPWESRAAMFFEKDSKMPELQTGISYVQISDYNEALNSFSNSMKQNENNPNVKPAQIAQIYWDIGLTYECMGRYDDAIAMMKKAYVLNPKPKYIQGQADTNQLREIDTEYKQQQESNK